MKIIFTEAALSDLGEILSYSAAHYPNQTAALSEKISAIIVRIALQPLSARKTDMPNIRVVPILRYPYLVFYLIREEHLEILHFRHIARRPWDT